MYNKDIKQEFIDSIESEAYQRRLKSLFDEVEPLEVKYNMDLYCIPKNEIAKYFMQHKAKRLRTLQNKITIINRYKEWANDKGYVPDEYKPFVYEKCDSRKIYNMYSKLTIFHTPAELKKMLKENFPLKSEYGITRDEIVSAYMMLLYQGINEKDIMDISASDVKEKPQSIVITTKQKDVIIYDEFRSLISKILKNRKYMSLSMANYGVKIMSDRFIDNGQSLTNSELKVIITKAIRRQIPHLDFRTKDLYIMGMIYKKISETGGDFDRQHFAIECYGNKYNNDQRGTLYDFLDQWEGR